jgi:hypothetical protein
MEGDSVMKKSVMKKIMLVMMILAMAVVMQVEAGGKKARIVESEEPRAKSQPTSSQTVTNLNTSAPEHLNTNPPGVSAPEYLGTTSVVTEVYVPRVLIEAKWGTNAGEFGGRPACYWEENNPFNDPYQWPKFEIAVSSRGEVYLLDGPDNRIEKFSPDGKFILQIPVDAFVGFTDYGRSTLERKKGVYEQCLTPLTSFGGKLMISSDDQIYYYTIQQPFLTNRVDTDENNDAIYDVALNPNAYGELWHIANDRVLRKIRTPVSRSVYIDIEDTVWVGTNKVLESEKVKKRKKPKIEIIRRHPGRIEYSIEIFENKPIIVASPDVLESPFVIATNTVRIFNRTKMRYEIIDSKGKIKKLRPLPYATPGIDVVDRELRVYRLMVNQSGVTVEIGGFGRKGK